MNNVQVPRWSALRWLGGACAALAAVVACSNKSPGASCPSPTFLASGACGSCISAACKASVDTACNAGGAFSNCFCSCTSGGQTPEACTLSCASSSCEKAVASCVLTSLTSGGCGRTCGATKTGGPIDAGQDATSDSNPSTQVCSYTWSGAQSGSASCLVQITDDGMGNLGFQLLPDGAPGPEVSAVISTAPNLALKIAHYTNKKGFSAVGTWSDTKTDGAWGMCWPKAGATCYEDDEGDNKPTAPFGSFTLDITSTGTPVSIGKISMWPFPHGTMSATFPPAPAKPNPASGTMSISATFY